MTEIIEVFLAPPTSTHWWAIVMLYWVVLEHAQCMEHAQYVAN